MDISLGLDHIKIQSEYKSLIEKLNLGLFMFSLDGNHLFSNEKFKDFFGYSEDELNQKSLIDLFFLEDIPALLNGFTMASRESEYETIKVKGRKKDNSTIFLQLISFKKYEDSIVLHLSEISDQTNINGTALLDNQLETEKTNGKVEHKENDLILSKIYNELDNFKFALDQSATVSVTDPDGNIIYVNDMFCKVSKYKREELIGQNHRIVNSNYHPKEVFEQMWSTIIQGKVWNGEVRNQAKDGTIWWSNATIIPFLDEGGKPYMYVSVRSDITKQKEIEKELRKSKDAIQLSEQRLHALVEHSYDVIGILDDKGDIKYISPALEKLTNSKVSKIIGRNIFDFLHADEVLKFKKVFEDVLKISNQLIKTDVRLNHDSEKWSDCEVILKNLLDEPAVNGISINLRDITNSKKAAKTIHQMAYYDQLTGFPNKKLFESYIKDEFQQASKTNRKFSLIYLDMDGFKYINDSLGSKIGDTLLEKIALRLRNCISQKGILSRMEGDEFGILLPNFSNGQLKEISEDILELFKDPFYINEYELYVTTSIGGSTYPYSGEDVLTLIASAHSALYEAKEKGKNKYQISSPHLNIATYKKFTLKNDLRKAIQNDEFNLYYQPRIEPKMNKIIAAEALIRWEHPKWGVISPSEFISLAEEAGLIGTMGEKVLYNACKQNKQWQLAGLPPIIVSVNFSVLQFLETDMLNIIDKILKDTDLEPRWLEIEITETAFMKDEKTVLARIEQFKKMGINIAIDDFGTGYSSLSYLKKLKANTLKIDKTFIDNIPADQDSTEIVSSVIHLAQKLNIRTVAEGVENLDQLSFLKKIHCDEIQGYLYSRPVEVKEFEKLLKQVICKPHLKNALIKEEMKFENRRNFFRIELPVPLGANMTITEFGGKKVQLGSTKILIRDIGPGGLQIETNIKLPVRSDLILKFMTRILGQTIELYGSIVWNKEIDDIYNLYGINFMIDENSRTHLTALLNQLQAKLRHDTILPDSLFVRDKKLYFNPQNKETR